MKPPVGSCIVAVIQILAVIVDAASQTPCISTLHSEVNSKRIVFGSLSEFVLIWNRASGSLEGDLLSQIKLRWSISHDHLILLD